MPKAMSSLLALGGSGVGGTVSFAQAEGGLEINARVSGLKPGTYAIHIHEFGDCSAPDGSSAGAHFNPKGEPHGGPGEAKRHAGDLGNLVADQSGVAYLRLLDDQLVLAGTSGILGRSVIVHAGPDDFRTQPSGNAGGRIACGLIGLVKSE